MSSTLEVPGRRIGSAGRNRGDGQPASLPRACWVWGSALGRAPNSRLSIRNIADPHHRKPRIGTDRPTVPGRNRHTLPHQQLPETGSESPSRWTQSRASRTLLEGNEGEHRLRFGRVSGGLTELLRYSPGCWFGCESTIRMCRWRTKKKKLFFAAGWVETTDR
jgi:hypothetical protein